MTHYHKVPQELEVSGANIDWRHKFACLPCCD